MYSTHLNLLTVLRAEYQYKNIEAYPRLGRRANILDSITLPLVGI